MQLMIMLHAALESAFYCYCRTLFRLTVPVQALSRHPAAGAKQSSQEQLSPEGESITYNQIKLVKALMQQGISWNDLIVNPPGPARVAQPTFPSAPATTPLQDSTGGYTDREDDDVIPF